MHLAYPSASRRPGVIVHVAPILACLILLASLPVARPAQAAGPSYPGLDRMTYLPLTMVPSAGCPPSSAAHYDAITFEGSPTDRVAERHADLNLGLRGYVPVAAPLELVDYDGGTDGDAPQIPAMLPPGSSLRLVNTWQVYNWNWDCGPDGCRDGLLGGWPATLIGMEAAPGAPIYPPSRGSQIYGGGYIALVLYAGPNRLTLKYTREDNVIAGYTVHLEHICVDPNLLTRYRELDAAGRPALPAVRNGQALGTVMGNYVAVAIRDWGTFLDPRSRKDWWRGY